MRRGVKRAVKNQQPRFLVEFVLVLAALRNFDASDKIVFFDSRFVDIVPDIHSRIWYKYVNELTRMGAKITVEGKVAIVKGVRKLSGAEVNSTDLRGGAALVTAALAARGKSKINNIEYILRGYENLDKKLKNIGAKIKIEK